jgi:hypothetical protein
MAWTSPIFCRNAYRMPIVSVDDLQRRAETVDCRSGSANGMIFYPQSAPHSTHLTAKANGRSSVPATQTPPRRRLKPQQSVSTTPVATWPRAGTSCKTDVVYSLMISFPRFSPA